MPPELERPPPPYLQIVEHYRGLIRDGRLGDGERLPSTRELARQWQVAHATAAKVLGTLRADGLVTAVSGGAGGTLVRRIAPAVVEAQHGGATDDGHAVRRVSGGLAPVVPGTARVLDAAVVPDPPVHVRDALGLRSGDGAIRRRQVLTADGVPVSVSTGWFPAALADVAPALLVAERVAGGTAGYVAAHTGRVLGSGRDELRIGPAGPDAAADLAVDAGTPVLVTRSWVHDRDGGVVEYGEATSTAAMAFDYAIA